MKQTRKSLIARCHYYKGESKEDNPYEGTDCEMLWYYESCWVDFSLNSPDSLIGLVKEYKYDRLDKILKRDGVPMSLKALLYNRYTHWSMGSPAGFRKWYFTDYLKTTFEDIVRSRKPRKCPLCGGEVVEIMYGEPMMSEEDYFKTYHKHVVYGGCCISEDSPQWQCRICEAEMYKK
jgi:hypothetical protein